MEPYAPSVFTGGVGAWGFAQIATRVLHGYWRSSAAYRVRIALNWKQLAYDQVTVNLRTGEQLLAPYRAKNPQGFVPLLVDGDTQVSQSLAIIEYLEESYPHRNLLPRGPARRARARAMAQVIACDIHPLNNLRVLKYLADPIGQSQPQVESWARHWIQKGFETLEALADGRDPFIAGEEVTLADVCLVPQLYNARRVNTDLAPYPRLLEIEERLQSMPAFAGARPEVQADAVTTA